MSFVSYNNIGRSNVSKTTFRTIVESAKPCLKNDTANWYEYCAVLLFNHSQYLVIKGGVSASHTFLTAKIKKKEGNK